MEANRVLPGQGLGHFIRIRHKHSKNRMFFRIIIKPPGQPPNGSCFGQTMQRNAHCSPVSQIEKLVWRKYPTPAVSINTAKYLLFCSLHVL